MSTLLVYSALISLAQPFFDGETSVLDGVLGIVLSRFSS